MRKEKVNKREAYSTLREERKGGRRKGGNGERQGRGEWKEREIEGEEKMKKKGGKTVRKRGRRKGKRRMFTKKEDRKD